MDTIISTKCAGLSALKVLMIALIILSSGKTHGQSKNELSVHLKGPFSTLFYEHHQDKQSLQNGLGFGVNYSYYLNKKWSIATGVELQSFEGNVHYDYIKDSYQTVDIEGDGFEFRYELKNFFEEQSAYYLNIPVGIRFETGGQMRFYAAGGAKIGFNLKSDYESDASSLTTSGYYEQYDAELTSPEFIGFGQFKDIRNGKRSFDLKTNYMLELESGVKFLLEKERAFYMGLFFDYGLNDIIKNRHEKDLLAYNSEDPSLFLLESVLTATGSGKTISKVRAVAFGLKIRYAFGL